MHHFLGLSPATVRRTLKCIPGLYAKIKKYAPWCEGMLATPAPAPPPPLVPFLLK